MNKIVSMLICIFLLVGCKKKENVLFFGTELTQKRHANVFVHDPNWLAISNLDEIYHIIIPAEESALTIRKTLANFIPDTYESNSIVTAIIYTTNTDTSKVNIVLDKVQAISFVRQKDENLYHNYFKKEGGRFVQLPELTAKVNAGFNLDDLRLLHFASVAGNELPKVSSIIEFRMKLFQDFNSEGNIDKSIGDAILMNMDLNKGMNTLDIYGEHFFAVMLADNLPNPGNHSCGGDKACGAGASKDQCIHVPAGPEQGKCHIVNGGGCFNAVLSYAFKQIDNKIMPFDLIRMYKFKDDFLLNYPKGRQFIAYMYLMSRYMRMDKAALDNNLKLLMVSEKAMLKIQDKDDKAVIIDEELMNLSSTFIQLNKGRGSKELQQALTVLETDLLRLKGATRNQVIEYLKEPVTNKRIN